MRQVVLDTETTGLEPSQGHRVWEIGAVEIIDRKRTGRHYHQYLNPQRAIDEEAKIVTGMNDEFLLDKPLFVDVVEGFLDFIRDAELVIHNADFDIGFLDHELNLLAESPGQMSDFSTVLDSLHLAREMHPGMRNSLDALCKRYDIDNSRRTVHGALLDAELLADVYLAMTGGQTTLSLAVGTGQSEQRTEFELAERPPIVVRTATDQELLAHQERLNKIADSAGQCLWQELDTAAPPVG